MAQAFVTLTANGTEIEGEPTMPEVGGDDLSGRHDVVRFRHELSRGTGTHAGSPHATGHADYGTIACTLLWSAGLPLLLQALSQNQATEATFDFYTNDSATGATVKLMTVATVGGRCTRLAYDLDPPAVHPFTVEVEFSFQGLTMTHAATGNEAQLTETASPA